MPRTVPKVDTRNPKDIIIAGLQMKVDALGEIVTPIEISRDYPSRETYEHDLETGKYNVQRIIVRKLENTVDTPAIGHIISEEVSLTETPPVSRALMGWEDNFLMEISVWSTGQDLRDNLVELIKVWMLELEQEKLEDGIPYFLSHEIDAVTFLRAYEDVNMHLYRNGPIYIGTLVYKLGLPFMGKTKEEYVKYKLRLIANLRAYRHTLQIDLSGGQN